MFHCLQTLRRHVPSVPPGAGPDEVEILSLLSARTTLGH